MRHSAVLIFALCLGSGLAAVQTPPAPAAKSSGGTSGQGALLEHSLLRTSWNADGTGTTELTATIQMQSQAGVAALAVLAFPYVRDVQTLTIVSVSVRQPDGTVIATPAANVEDMSGAVTQTAPMYSDLREKHVVIKGLDVGDTLAYDIRWQMVKPRWPGQFWYDYTFPASVVSTDEEVEIAVPEELAVQVVSPGLKPQQRQAGGQTIYDWKYARAAGETAPPPTVAVTTLKSWAQVGAWYWGLSQPQQALTPAIRAKAAALTQGLSSDQAKIEAIYQFVANHIHYVALDFGSGDYQPHAAEAVLENGYGDCKDQQTLLAALLGAEGYPAWPALINASGTKLLADAPSPAQFDHVITVVPRGDGKQDWLDTTPGVAPYGMLMANLRDEQALVIPADAPAALATTPADPPFPSDIHFDAQGALDAKGTLTAHVSESLRGDSGVLVRLAFRLTPSAKWPDLVKVMMREQGFGGEATNVNASDPEDTTSAERWSFDYSRSDYGGWADHDTSAFLAPLSLTLPDKAPAGPITLGAPGTRTFHSQITLPAGFTPTLPTAVDLSNDWLEYHAAYSFANGVLTSERRIVIKQDKAPPAAFAALSKFNRAMMADENALIALASPADPSDAQAAALFDAAHKAFEARNFDQAIQKLQQFVKLRPRDPGAWDNLGLAYARESRNDDAIAAFNTELRVDPVSTAAHEGLAVTYLREGKAMDAEAQIRQVLALNPKDASAAIILSEIQKHSVLLGALSGGAPTAETELDEGARALRAGDTSKAVTALNQAVATDPTPIRMITVAHLLSDKDQDLGQARQYVTSALPTLQILLKGANVAHLQPQQLTQVATLGEGWATLGWIDFLQGNTADAQDYLAAAWNLTQSPEVADHLGQLYQKLGRRADAQRFYADALAAGGHPPADARARLEALTGKSAAGAVVMQETDVVMHSRLVRIPSAGLPAGSAQFLISFDPGPKVDGAKFDSGDAGLKAAVPALTAAHYNVVFPKGVVTTLVRRGELDCEPGVAACDFVLIPTPDLTDVTAGP